MSIIRFPKETVDALPEPAKAELLRFKIDAHSDAKRVAFDDADAGFKAAQAAAIKADAEVRGANRATADPPRPGLMDRVMLRATRSRVAQKLLVARITAKRIPGEQGIGDTIERLLRDKWYGGKLKDKLIKLGLDCGCPGRQQLLNLQHPYRNVAADRGGCRNCGK